MDELLTTIEEVKAGKYQKKLVSSASIEENAKGGFLPVSCAQEEGR